MGGQKENRCERHFGTGPNMFPPEKKETSSRQTGLPSPHSGHRWHKAIRSMGRRAARSRSPVRCLERVAVCWAPVSTGRTAMPCQKIGDPQNGGFPVGFPANQLDLKSPVFSPPMFEPLLQHPGLPLKGGGLFVSNTVCPRRKAVAG